MSRINILDVIFALFSVASCVPPKPQQHKVRVVDAETGAPVGDAVINLYYFPSLPEAPDPNHPRAIANAQGEVMVPSKAEMAIWQVQAEGYIEQQLSSNEGVLPPRYAAHATGGYGGVIYLYQIPEPQLSILVSETYIGPLTIYLEPAPGFDYVLLDEINVAFAAVDPQASYIQEPSLVRVFTATASAEGTVALLVAPLLYDIEACQLQVRDSAGVLPWRDIANPQDTERGVWGSVSKDAKRLHRQVRLFVGTLGDYQEFLKSVQ